MITSKRRLNTLFTLGISMIFVTASSLALANNGNGGPDNPPGQGVGTGKPDNLPAQSNSKGKKPDGLPTQSKGKAIGLVNRLNGNTIDYSSLDNEEAEPEEEAGAPAPGRGRSNNIGQGNASNGLKARLFINRDIIYTGDPLEVGLLFPRGATLISTGQADAFLVIFSPPLPFGGDEDTVPPAPVVVPLNPDIVALTEELETEQVEAEEEQQDDSSRPRRLFHVPAVDTSAIPAGTYQLGLILTVPGGDPLLLDDWFNGLLGLVHIRGLTISDQALPADLDGDGMMDCAADIEGMTCDEGTGQAQNVE